MWQNIEAAPVDSIFGLTDAFRKHQNPKKVNHVFNHLFLSDIIVVFF